MDLTKDSRVGESNPHELKLHNVTTCVDHIGSMNTSMLV